MITLYDEQDMLGFALFIGSNERKEFLKENFAPAKDNEDELNKRFQMLTPEDIDIFIFCRAEAQRKAQAKRSEAIKEAGKQDTEKAKMEVVR